MGLPKTGVGGQQVGIELVDLGAQGDLAQPVPAGKLGRGQPNPIPVVGVFDFVLVVEDDQVVFGLASSRRPAKSWSCGPSGQQLLFCWLSAEATAWSATVSPARKPIVPARPAGPRHRVSTPLLESSRPPYPAPAGRLAASDAWGRRRAGLAEQLPVYFGLSVLPLLKQSPGVGGRAGPRTAKAKARMSRKPSPMLGKGLISGLSGESLGPGMFFGSLARSKAGAWLAKEQADPRL